MFFWSVIPGELDYSLICIKRFCPFPAVRFCCLSKYHNVNMADLFSLSKTIFLSIWKQQALIFHITKIKGKNSLEKTETRYRGSTPTSTHEGACSWNRLVQQNCPWNLLPRIKPVWYDGAKPGSKSFVEQHSFSLEIVGADEGASLRELVARSCYGSKLPCVCGP